MIRRRFSYVCPLATTPITVDRILDEDAWQGADVIREFSVPVTHEAPRQETEARIISDLPPVLPCDRIPDKPRLG